MMTHLARVVGGLSILVALIGPGASAQNRPAAPATPRIYVFENGSIKGLDPALFNFTRQEIKEPDFTVISYLIVHPRGTLMFDSGVIPDSSFQSFDATVTSG